MSLIDNLKTLVKPAPKTLDELRPVIHDAAQLAYRIDAVQAEFDTASAIVTKEYGGLLGTLKKQYATAEKVIVKFFGTHRDLFGNSRSVVVDGHSVKLRALPGKVVCTKDDQAACDAIIATGDNELILAAINATVVPDKVTIKAIIESGGPMAETLRGIGFSVEKGETLSFKPAEHTADSTSL
jgi:hypothetical protein